MGNNQQDKQIKADTRNHKHEQAWKCHVSDNAKEGSTNAKLLGKRLVQDQKEKIITKSSSTLVFLN